LRKEHNIGWSVNVSSDGNDEIRKTHKVRRGDNLQSIAKRYSCSVTELKKWNRLKSTRLKAGQYLTVFVPEKKAPAKLAEKTEPVKPASTLVANQSTDSSNGSRFVYHVVAPGDTLWKIAQRYEGMTVDQIKEMNQLQTNDLKVGTRIKVKVQG